MDYGVPKNDPKFLGPASSSSLEDVQRPLDLSKVAKGWHSVNKEYSYWVPVADVEGTIPQQLQGTLFRNGPGLLEVYGKKLIHPIDGDGMVVALTFQGGRVHLRSRFVATRQHLEEQHQKAFIYRGQMGTHPNSPLKDTALLIKNWLSFRWPKLQYRNPSNTNVFYWGGKVVSAYETGLPYTLDPYSLDTLGPDTFNGALTLKAFAAHFRMDMEQERLICIALRPGLKSLPYLAIYEFDKQWKLVDYHMYRIKGLNYSHDFLIVRDYFIFHMTPFVSVDLKTNLLIFTGWSSPGQTMAYYSSLPSRFVVIPRHKGAKYQEVRFFDSEPFHIFHFCNSEQRADETIAFDAVCLGPKFNMTFDKEIWLSNTSVAPGNVFRFSLDPTSGKCERSSEPADPASVEFPTIHPYRHGKSTRYSYLMASDRPGCSMPYRDVVKYDCQGGKRQVWNSHGCVGEPVFVPRLGLQSWCEGEEDDGFVLVQLYVPETHCTEFIVLDAQRVGQGPIARIKLRHHIPYGFHGTFTPEVFVDSSHIHKAKL